MERKEIDGIVKKYRDLADKEKANTADIHTLPIT